MDGCSAKTDVTEVPKAPHSYGSGTITTAPTCTEDGVKTFTCSKCNKTKTEVINKLGHTYDSGSVTTEPTCEDDGVKTFTCSNCGDTYAEVVSAIGHNPVDGYCTVCGEKVAGLYDASGTMLCSWEESGIDVGKNYTFSTYDTETTSPYYVLTHNYPTATKVIIPDGKRYI